jgi:hypothetical protein
MKIKVYVLRLTVGLFAFGLAIGLLNVGRYLKSVWQTKPEQIAALRLSVEKETANVKTLIQNAEIELSKAEETSNSEPYGFDAFGDYFIPGDAPTGFKDFGIISIETRDYENYTDEFPNGVPIPPTGYVNAGRKFNFKRINIANRQIAFETESSKGISYKFVGKFLDEITYDDITDSNLILKGRLTKMQKGKKSVGAEVNLAIDNTCGC